MIRGAALVVLLALGGPAAAAPAHDLLLADTATVVEGERAAISLTVAPRPGHTVSRSGPLRIHLATPEPGLELPRQRYRLRDAADSRADAPRFDLAVRGARPGTYRLEITVRFWLCRRRTCWPVRDRREVAVTVEPKPPPAPAP